MDIRQNVGSGKEDNFVTIKTRFNKLDSDRNSILQRKRDCAKLTIPSLLPPRGSTEDTVLPTPYQGFGARGVNNLASKLLLTLLPPNAPFFRLVVDDFTLEEMTGEPDARAEVEKALNKIERAVMSQIEVSAIRVPTFEALKLLITTGDALLYMPDDGGMKVYRVDSYVIDRDPMGNVLEIIIKEKVHPNVLPDETRAKVQALVEGEDKQDEHVDIYTRVVRTEDNKWEVAQECLDEVIPGTEGWFKKDECPWIPLRWSSCAGENYGRGHVEQYLGDLRTLEALTKAITEGSVLAAFVVWMVNPNGSTRPHKLKKADNGEFIDGRADDVTALQIGKQADFEIANATAVRIEQRLAQAFLLMQSVQRDAERVTAEEIRAMAKELEDSLGGVYSILSQEFQLPVVRRLMVQMSKQNKLPTLPSDIVSPMIVTGLEALGRGNDLNKLIVFSDIIQKFAEEGMAYLNIGDFLTRAGTSLGMDTAGLVKTEEEVAEMQQQQMMLQMMQQSAPGVAQAATKGAMDGVNQQQQQQQQQEGGG